MANKYRSVIRTVLNEPWVIRPEKLEAIASLLDERDLGIDVDEAVVQERIGIDGRSAEAAKDMDGIRILDVFGVLAPRMNMMMRVSGGTSTQLLSKQIAEAAKDDSVKTVIMRIDSPGGAVSFTPETATAIRNLAKVKRVVSSAENNIHSGAYWIGSAAELYASESTGVGNVGVYTIAVNTKEATDKAGVKYRVFRAGEFKAMLNPHEDWTEAQIENEQSRIDGVYHSFVSAVAEHRGLSAETVRSDFGKGSYFFATEAKNRGMIDGVATFEEVLSRERDRLTSKSSVFISEERESMKITERVKSALHARGLVQSADASDETCVVALNSFCIAVGESWDDKSEGDLCTLLFASKAPAKKEENVIGVIDLTSDPEPTATDERIRQKTIRARAQNIPHVTAEMIETALDSGISADEVVGQWIDNAADAENDVSIQPGPAQVDKFVDGAAEVILNRVGLSNDPEALQHGASLAHATSNDIIRQYLTQEGERTSNNPEENALTFLQYGGLGTRMIGAAGTVNQTGDHPYLMDSLMNKSLQRQLPVQDVKFPMWAGRLEDVPDFRMQSTGEVGMFTDLDLFTESDDVTPELKFDSQLRSYYKVDRFRNKIGLTVEMITNDQLGGFARQLSTLPNAGQLKLNRLCLDMLNLNPALPDGIAIFHTSHGNLIASGGGPDHTQLAAMRKLHRNQTRFTGNNRTPERIDADMKYALVSANWETLAKQTLLIGVNDPKVANTDATVNTVRGEVMPIIEPRLGDYNEIPWYTSIGGDVEIVIGYAYQRGFGASGQRTTWYDNDSTKRFVAFEVRFTAAAVGYRGMCKNAGQ